MRNFCINVIMYSKLQDYIRTYEDIDCRFVVCHKCFWTATIFNSAKGKNSKKKVWKHVQYAQPMIYLYIPYLHMIHVSIDIIG